MRYFISFILILFCSTSLFSQSSGDTVKVKDTVDYKIIHLLLVDNDSSSKKLSSFWCKPIINTLPIIPETLSYYSIVHENHSAFGLPTFPFRFENVNQMANTVAGVLSMDGETPSILGARREGTAYYFNGVRIMDNTPAIEIPTPTFTIK